MPHNPGPASDPVPRGGSLAGGALLWVREQLLAVKEGRADRCCCAMGNFHLDMTATSDACEMSDANDTPHVKKGDNHSAADRV